MHSTSKNCASEAQLYEVPWHRAGACSHDATFLAPLDAPLPALTTTPSPIAAACTFSLNFFSGSSSMVDSVRYALMPPSRNI
jgi:hypothetical protein